MNTTDTSVVCECNHLTHFAILLSPNLKVRNTAIDECVSVTTPYLITIHAGHGCKCFSIAGHRICGCVHLFGMYGDNHCGSPGTQVSQPVIRYSVIVITRVIPVHYCIAGLCGA